MSSSGVWYYQGAERPALRLWLQDDDGELIDFSSGWTFEFKIGRTGSTALLTKTAGVAGAVGSGSQPLGTPNVVVTWVSGELDLPVGFYDWMFTATSAGLQRRFGGRLEIRAVIL